MTENNDLEKLAKELDWAFHWGVEEFIVDSFKDNEATKIAAAAKYLRGEGYAVRMLGRRGIDNDNDLCTRYSLVVNPKKVD